MSRLLAALLATVLILGLLAFGALCVAAGWLLTAWLGARLLMAVAGGLILAACLGLWMLAYRGALERQASTGRRP